LKLSRAAVTSIYRRSDGRLIKKAPLNVTTNLKSDLIGGLFRSDLHQANDNGITLDLVFTNSPVDVSVACANSPLSKLDHHHKAYQIKMRDCCCKFEAMESRTQCCMFKMADCVAILNELDMVDWFILLWGLRMDCCVDRFY
jgi:hypothetical protein